MAMRRGDSPGKCREFGAGAGDPRIVTSAVRAPCVGLALDGGRIGHPGRSVARMHQGRHATIPEGVGRAGSGRQKLGGGARASPPHKTLSGFDISIHYTRSEPAVDQPGGEFHGSVRGGARACAGRSMPCSRASTAADGFRVSSLETPACPCRSSSRSRRRLCAAWRAASRPRAPRC